MKKLGGSVSGWTFDGTCRTCGHAPLQHDGDGCCKVQGCDCEDWRPTLRYGNSEYELRRELKPRRKV